MSTVSSFWTQLRNSLKEQRSVSERSTETQASTTPEAFKLTAKEEAFLKIFTVLDKLQASDKEEKKKAEKTPKLSRAEAIENLARYYRNRNPGLTVKESEANARDVHATYGPNNHATSEKKDKKTEASEAIEKLARYYRNRNPGLTVEESEANARDVHATYHHKNNHDIFDVHPKKISEKKDTKTTKKNGNEVNKWIEILKKWKDFVIDLKDVKS